MNRIQAMAVCSTVSVALLAVPAFGQNRDDRRDDRNNQSPSYQSNGSGDRRDQNNDRNNQGYRNDSNRYDMNRNGDRHDGYVRHDEWRRGYRLRHEDWDRGQRVNDWRAHQLRRPPRGYEWRQLDGNYVLGSINTGVISMTIMAR